ncbi:MAG: hypothetical protein ABIB79_03830 [archaeon]
MRCTQVYGLNEAARNMIHDCTPVTRVTRYLDENGGLISENEEKGYAYDRVKHEKYADANNTGMFDDGPNLMRHTLHDGTVYLEDVQAVPWSSGPCIFLALKDTKGTWIPETLWSEEEIRNA